MDYNTELMLSLKILLYNTATFTVIKIEIK